MNLFRTKKGQIAPLMVFVVVIVILAIGATMLIGELGYQKVRLANTVDAAVISSGAELARTLNLVRQIHFRLLLNHIRMQVMLLARGIWPHKSLVWAYIAGYAEGLDRAQDLYNQAKELVKDLPKDIRSSLYERIFGGQVDELKAYYERNGTLDTDRYLREDTFFQTTFRDFKYGRNAYSGNPLAGKDNWHLNNALSYSWNRTVFIDGSGNKRLIPGTLVIGSAEPTLKSGGKNYDSYLQIKISAPTRIYIKPQMMILFFLYVCGPSVCPGFLLNPYAWISRVNIDTGCQFGADVRKLPFRKFAYLMSESTPNANKEITQSSYVNITACSSTWTGHDVKLTR